MTPIRIVQGDATSPPATDPKIIAHICNDGGRWGKGFVLAVSRRWPDPERDYRSWHHTGDGFTLGAVRLVPVEPNLWVANMIGQRGIAAGRSGPAPIRYDAVDRCLTALADEATDRGASVHMPRIGCGLAGGRWDCIEPLILERLSARGVPVTIYDPA